MYGSLHMLSFYSTLYNKIVMILCDYGNKQMHVWELNLSTHMYYFSTHTPLKWGAEKRAEKISTHKRVAGGWGSGPGWGEMTQLLQCMYVYIHWEYMKFIYHWYMTGQKLLLLSFWSQFWRWVRWWYKQHQYLLTTGQHQASTNIYNKKNKNCITINKE